MPKTNETLISKIIVSQKDLTEMFPSAIYYCFDSFNSHSTLLFEGLILKYRYSFFLSAVLVWGEKLKERSKEIIEVDLGSKFEELNDSIVYLTLESLESQEKTSQKMNKRAVVILEPFLLAGKLSLYLSALQKSAKKSTEPIYLLTLIADQESISKIKTMSPIFRIVVLFCIKSEQTLTENVKQEVKTRSSSFITTNSNSNTPFDFIRVLRSVSAKEILDRLFLTSIENENREGDENTTHSGK